MDDTAVILVRHKLDTDAYYLAAETGVLNREDRVELIEGEIIDMAPIGPDHEGAVMELTLSLVEACGRRALVSPQSSLRLGRWNAPQPDFVVFRPRADFYKRGERAGPKDALLVVEVSDSSLRYDTTVKLPLYARAEVGEVWIVDINRRVLTAYSDPSGDGFTTVSTYQPNDAVALALEPSITVVFELA